ncbi:RNI-like protein, partial [Violaceomyces palustris]
LPRELIIRCLELLVLSHVEDHRDGIENGSWRGRKASETRYVGLQAGIRELARLSRVCREWQNYVFDGQLWQTLDAGSFPEITESALVRIARASGPFVKRLDLRGLSRLSSSILFAIVDAHSTPSAKEDPTGDDRPHLGQGATLSSDRCLTSLIELDLESCSSVSSECLNQVLSRSPNLKKICLRNLTSVTNETCRILGRRAPGIEYIDVSRCPNVDGSGLLQLSPAKQARHDQTPEEALFSPLKELHAVALKGADAEFMASLGPAFPSLEVLDLSYSSDLTDRAIAAFTSIRGDISQEMGAFVELSSQQAGFDGQEPIYRRVFRLRKLAFSSCSHLTDRACTYLAHSVPYLEVLELANLGPHLRDQGLVRLLSTTPSIARLDLEGATEIRDNLISSLTPAGGSDQRVNSDCSSPYASDQPGSKLTHLIISSASHVSAAALLLLVQHCPSLVHLEADDTPAGDQLAREFVKLSRQRKAREAYLSLIDCRGLTRGTCSELNSSSAVRPRDGKRGYEFQRFLYDDAEEAGVTSTSAGGFAGGLDECNPSRVILKSFWGWQNVDNRLRAIRKAEMKAGKRRKSGGN